MEWWRELTVGWEWAFKAISCERRPSLLSVLLRSPCQPLFITVMLCWAEPQNLVSSWGKKWRESKHPTQTHIILRVALDGMWCRLNHLEGFRLIYITFIFMLFLRFYPKWHTALLGHIYMFYRFVCVYFWEMSPWFLMF